MPIFTCLKNTWDCSRYRFVGGVPAELNAQLSSGQIDLCPSSSIEYAKFPDLYQLLPDLSISSIGPVQSVLLLSRVPLEELDRQEIGLTGESATSVNLLKIILRRFHGFSNRFATLRASDPNALADFPAILLIGNAALQAYLRRTEGIYLYDLGELWHRYTGTPFVFALWMVRRDAVHERRDEVMELLSRLLHAKRIACETYETIAGSERVEGIDPREMVAYWKTISYDLTPSHMEGLGKFYRYAAELGLVRGVPDMEML